MRQITVKIQGGAASEIPLSESQIEQEVKDAVILASKISSEATVRLGKMLLNKKRRIKVKNWKEDSLIKKFFGSSPPSTIQMRKVHRRIARAHRRLSETHLVIRVRPRPSGSPNRRAQNLGTVFSPRRFKVYPAWFGVLSAEYDGNKSGENSSNSDLRRAAIMVHELNHDLFSDQKLNGDKVYGEKMAKDLARSKPRKARRSSENLEWFCMRLQDKSGKL